MQRAGLNWITIALLTLAVAACGSHTTSPTPSASVNPSPPATASATVDGEIDTLDEARAVFRRVAVDPDLRGRGHGSVLMALAESFVRARDRRVVLLHARATALPFYRKHGFVDAVWDEASMHAGSVKVAKRLDLAR